MFLLPLPPPVEIFDVFEGVGAVAGVGAGGGRWRLVALGPVLDGRGTFKTLPPLPFCQASRTSSFSSTLGPLLALERSRLQVRRAAVSAICRGR